MSNLTAIMALETPRETDGNPRRAAGTRDPELQKMLDEFDLLALIREDTGEEGRQSGDIVYFDGECPVCHRHEDFRFHISSNSWKCWGAYNQTGHEGGTAIDYFLATGKASDVREAVAMLREATGRPPIHSARKPTERGEKEPKATTAAKGVSDPMTRRYAQFLRERGFGSGDVNDKEISRLFGMANRDELAFVSGTWLAYDGTRWVAEGGAQAAERRMKAFVDALTVVSMELVDEEEKGKALRQVARYAQEPKRRNALKDAESELVRNPADFDSRPHLLNCLNRTIDLSGDKAVIREHRASDLLTQVAPVEYDESATCEEFSRTVATALEGDIETIEYLQKVFGKVIAGDVSEDCLFLLGEATRAGKTTVARALVDMLGTVPNGGYACNVDPKTFAPDNRSASAASSDRDRMKLAKLVVSSEPAKGMELDGQLLKKLTGGDEVTARPLYGKDSEFRMRGIIIMLCNEFPTVKDASVISSDRINCVPFEHRIPKEERDGGLRDRLGAPEARSGLLNWCLRGFELYHEEGFGVPESVKGATRDYMDRMDDVRAWARGRLIEGDGAVTAAECFADYQAHGGKVGAQREFTRRLADIVPMAKRGTVRGERHRNVIKGRTLAAEEEGIG